MPTRSPLALALLALACAPADAAPDFRRVPGTVVSHERSPNPLRAWFGKPRYIGSPSLAILPSGHYVVSHDLFTRGGGETETDQGITKVFRSTDRGRTWSPTARIAGSFWSTLFVHRGALYLFGYTKSGGDIVIRRSNDEGRTWTRPTGPTTGKLRTGRFGAAPNQPVVHNGRLWVGSGSTVMSAPVGSDLLRADAWQRARAPRGDRSTWLNGRFQSWHEAQVVASPTTGVVVMPKLKELPYTALQRVTTPSGRLAFDPNHDFVPLPGGRKKFGAQFDPVSGKFYVLSNPVLDRHDRDRWRPPFPGDDPQRDRRPPKQSLVRNTAAIYTSVDLRRWRLERVFLYDPDVHTVGFQYLDFEFDGPDMIVVARTAYRVGFWAPPRQHDSNLVTFHRIPNVRVLPADPLPRELRVPRAKIDGRRL